MSLVRVPTPRVCSTDASCWTLRRRSGNMSTVRDTISGGAAAGQLKYELAVLTDAEWRELLAAADLPTLITPEETLAMKADLILPWRKMCIVGKVCQLLEQNNMYTKPPCCRYHTYKCVIAVFDVAQTDNGQIPNTEVWVKIGGDKGADTVKFAYQLCDVPNPNSVQNMCLLCLRPETQPQTSI